MAELMRSLWFVGPGQLEWREKPVPVMQGAEDALVTPIVAGRCPFDVPVLDGRSPLPGDFAFGHEAVAKVVSVGESVTSVRPGDVVVVAPAISCGRCERCRRGWTAHCTSVLYGAFYGLAINSDWGGLFDDVVRVPYADAMLTRIPPEVDPYECIAAYDVLGTTHDVAVRQVRDAGRRKVLVLSWGASGLYQVAFAAAYGAEQVVYVDRNADNRALAETLGATTVLDSPPDPAGGRFELVIEVSGGNAEWLRRGIDLAAPEGVVESLGGLFGDVSVPTYQMFYYGITLRIARANNAPYVPDVLTAIRRGLVQPSVVYSHDVAWQDLPEAMLEPGRKLVATRDQA
ncbi:hypothetical protein GCM10012275_34480 [Longimycelium tulufanense]|uniref:Alcohol dehydrogenase n=1 Tax=Longimycelium tulufanense TaxID=907463 RepID=A0A8J3FXA4_9PSEU|nr:alcohol dehydrogenase catalytic domain-containing protein [Longimycelium tulufanense]GGM60433.1 hypothetical protein GCM10012275_34480 [Longimycelium tulufanense]